MRAAKIGRKTAETDVSVELNLDGEGKSEIDTGIGFFDHMLTLFTRHGLIDLKVRAKGDLNVDGHHTVEDVGIALGCAVRDALVDKSGIARYGSFYVPMDEALAFVAIDVSARPYLVSELGELAPVVGEFDTELTEEFLRAFCQNAGLTLHVRVIYGRNTHHKIEAVFKAMGHALRIATEYDPRVKGVLSTKGVI